MDIKQLKYFMTIVEEGNISQAAQRLHMAQPPLSQQLKSLETELGVTLIERNTRKLVTTDIGNLLYHRAKEIMEMVEGTTEEVMELSEGIRGTITIGTIASYGSQVLPERVRDFHQQYPKIHFQVWEGDTIRIMELVESRIIELGIARLPIDSAIFNSIHFPSEPFVAVYSRKWIIGEEPDRIRLSELAGQPLMLLQRHQGTSSYNQKIFINNIVEESCLNAGFVPNILCESNDITILLSWAYNEIGIAIVPKSAMNLWPGDLLQYKEIIEPSLQTRPSALIWLKNRYLSSAAKKFIEWFKQPI